MSCLILVHAALAADLSGSVYSAAGEPLVGVAVYAYNPRLDYASAETTSDGGFEIVGIPAGSYRLLASPNQDSDPANAVSRFWPDATSFCDATAVITTDDEAATNLDFSLPVGGTLGGRLLDGDGAPVADAYVACYGISDRSAYSGSLVTTDAEGRFTVVGIDADAGQTEPHVCEAFPETFPQQALGGTYDADEGLILQLGPASAYDVGDWELLPGIVVEGQVSGPDGPVDSGVVYVYASSQAVAVEIDVDGRYRASGLPPGEVVAWAESDGYATTYYPDTDRPAGRVEVLEEGAIQTGVDLTMPYESVLELTLAGEGGGDLSEMSVLLYNSERTVGRGDGVTAGGTATIDALFPGDYSLYVWGSDAGYVNDYLRGADGQEQVVRVDGDTRLQIDLIAASSVSGQVWGEDGEPLGGALMAVFTAEDGVGEMSELDGSWEVGGLGAMSMLVRASYYYSCPDDPGFVTLWWQDSYDETSALPVSPGPGEALGGLDFSLLYDNDHDTMGDTWELAHGLDPGRDDSAEDADGDGYSNLEEWLLGTDPHDPADRQGLGCTGCAGEGKSWLWLGLFGLGGLRRRTGRPATGAYAR